MQIKPTVTMHPFSPIVFQDTKTLILGTFPSKADIKLGFYHLAKGDKFWQMLQNITKYPINNKDQKLWLLKEYRLGLWDILSQKNNQKDEDFQISDERVNDIESIIYSTPSITRIALMGANTQAIYKEFFLHLPLEQMYLPSALSSHSQVSFELKADAYRQMLSK